MIVETLFFLILSIITARLLERRYKVASIFHAIFFILVATYFLYITDYQPIVNIWLRYIDPRDYYLLKEALIGNDVYVYSAFHTIVLVEIIAFIFVPFLSIVAFVQMIRDEFKKMDVSSPFQIDGSPIDNYELDNKEFVPLNNDLYLKYQVLLN